MSMFSKSKITDPIEPKPASAAPNQAKAAVSPSPAATPQRSEAALTQTAATSTSASGRPSLISNDLRVVGTLETSGDLEIEGSVEGDVRANVLTIGEGASIVGEVIASDVTVRGRIKGRVRALRVHLMDTARVDGEIQHKTMSIDPGAQFQGSVSMSDNPIKGENVPGGSGQGISQLTATTIDAAAANSPKP